MNTVIEKVVKKNQSLGFKIITLEKDLKRNLVQMDQLREENKTFNNQIDKLKNKNCPTKTEYLKDIEVKSINLKMIESEKKCDFKIENITTNLLQFLDLVQ